jgi:hypothetical protein
MKEEQVVNADVEIEQEPVEAPEGDEKVNRGRAKVTPPGKHCKGHRPPRGADAKRKRNRKAQAKARKSNRK